VSGPEPSRTSASASPAAASSAAYWPAGSGSGLPAAVMNASASSGCPPPCRQDPGRVVAVNPGTATASWRSIHASCASLVASTPAPAPADHGLSPSPSRAFPGCATRRAGCQGPAPTSAPPAATPPGHPPAGQTPAPRPPFPGPFRPRSGCAPAHRTLPTRTWRTTPPTDIDRHHTDAHAHWSNAISAALCKPRRLPQAADADLPMRRPRRMTTQRASCPRSEQACSARC